MARQRTAGPDHTCIEAINDALKSRGVELSLAYSHGRQSGVVTRDFRVMVEPLEGATVTQQRAASKLNILATYCPFCGMAMPRTD